MDGLKVGLEIHQQLDTLKLFCNCSSIMSDGSGRTVERELRTVRSEMGDVDAAAARETLRGRRFTYETDDACLVELDEEPPHGLNPEALDIALTCSLMFGARPVDEVHIMRKIVVDGSNTAGFQRTGLIAMGGTISTPDGDVAIQTICLEEDAARKIAETVDGVTYRLDRLGIPLIEVATAPDITSPGMAYSCAARIGSILRATGRVKRGLGTIRQDLNISIPDGARVEIKGVQDLRMIRRAVEVEVQRQEHLLSLVDVIVDEVVLDPVDLCRTFLDTDSGPVSGALSSGAVVLGQRLDGCSGHISSGGRSVLGRELSAHARAFGAGVMHSDELPGHGISPREVDAVRKALGCAGDDAFVLILGSGERARLAMDAVVRRMNAVREGVPTEVRRALPDGTTEFLRPMPGAARMYPETDVPPVAISSERLTALILPEMPDVKIERLVSEHGLHPQIVKKVISDCEDAFNMLVRAGVSPSLASRTLINTFSELRSKGLDPSALTMDALVNTLTMVTDGGISGQAVPDVLEAVLGGADVGEAIETLGLSRIDGGELETMARELVSRRSDFIASKGEAAVDPLMGDMMALVGGRADGKSVRAVLKKAVEDAMKDL